MGITDTFGDALDAVQDVAGAASDIASNPGGAAVQVATNAIEAVPEPVRGAVENPVAVAIGNAYGKLPAPLQDAAGEVQQMGAVAVGTVASTLPVEQAQQWGTAINVGGDVLSGALKVASYGDDIAGFLKDIFSNKAVLIVLAIVVALWLLSPILRPAVHGGVRVAAVPARMAYKAKQVKHRGFSGNLVHLDKRLQSAPPRDKRHQTLRRRMSIPNRQAVQGYRGHGSFATIVGRTPPAPMEPRQLIVRATDHASAVRCVKRNVPGRSWKVDYSQRVSMDLSDFIFSSSKGKP